jgi:hypothetical protein
VARPPRADLIIGDLVIAVRDGYGAESDQGDDRLKRTPVLIIDA